MTGTDRNRSDRLYQKPADCLHPPTVYAERMVSAVRIVGIELGGTKAIGVLWLDGVIIDEIRLPTRDPDSTLADLFVSLDRWWQDGPFTAIGVASFGPVALDPAATRYGCILTTTKVPWIGAPILPRIAARYACPIAIDTDVNGAAMAEYRWGSGQGARSLVYLTIGTGVGGGALIDGRPVHGRLHPEMGHMKLRRKPGDSFAGRCLYHGDCIEGLIAGPALAARFGTAAEALEQSDPRWDDAAWDLAQLLAALWHSYSPDRLLVGGGVGMGAPHMLERARELLLDLLGGYYADTALADICRIITLPDLGDRAGPLGAVAVGLTALERHTGS